MADLHQLERELTERIAAAGDERTLEDIRVAALGKKGAISDLLRALGTMSPDEHRVNGPLFNGLRDRVTALIAARKDELGAAALNTRLASESVDVTLPVPEPRGSVHPVSQVMAEVTAIFGDLGFSVA